MGICRFMLQEDITELSEINSEIICTNAKYRFDVKVLCQPNDIFELDNAQWFLVRHGERTLIHGKWEPVPYC